MKLFQYAAYLVAPDGESGTIILPSTSTLAKNKESLQRKIIRMIPAEYEEQLDKITILIIDYEGSNSGKTHVYKGDTVSVGLAYPIASINCAQAPSTLTVGTNTGGFAVTTGSSNTATFTNGTVNNGITLN